MSISRSASPGTTMDTLLSPRRRTVLQTLGAAALLAGCAEVFPTGGGARQFRGDTMGAFYTLKLAGDLSDTLAERARDAVHTALATVDALMSTHRGESELSRFNAHRSSDPFVLSAATFDVFRTASRVSEFTSGAFDVTVAPLVDAWGFGADRRPRMASESEVRALERRVGWRKLHLDDTQRSVRKLDPDVRADLSGIAKGYGVDRAAAALDALGLSNYMIEAGGEVRVRGRNANGKPWQIAIEEPDAVPQRPRFVVPLTDASIATSGDYRIYFEREGTRYSHEIDPQTGSPMRSGLASVSVVADRCAVADALGKLIVLGPQAAYARAVALDLPAYFIVRESGGVLRDVMTPAFARLGGHRYA